MIELRTGLPGAGKTLFAIWQTYERAKKERREVFYSGIRDCLVPGWKEFGAVVDPERPWNTDASEWYQLPKNSIIVIDEAQRLFRPRHYAKEVPPYVSELETHRHKGLDLVLITQEPRLLDANVRRLVGRHVHAVRAFGANGVTLHEWSEVREDTQSRDDSIRALTPYPKEVFSWYKSAEVHTHKVHIPRRVWFVAAVPILVAICVFVAYRSLSRLSEPSRVSGSPAASSSSASSSSRSDRDRRPSLTPLEYAESYVPRVSGLPHTALVYDSVTQPKTAPYPAACIASSTRCVCYTQQATQMEVGDDLCRSIVTKGFFKNWQEPLEGDRQAQGSGGVVGSPQGSAGTARATVPAVPQIVR